MILQARLQQYVNRKLPDVQAGFRKGRGGRRLPAGDLRNLRVSSAKMELLTFIWVGEEIKLCYDAVFF